jgi:hypothetical protein
MRRHRQPHETICQANVCEEAFWFVMEVKEISTVELKYRRAQLSKRGVSAKDIQKRRDAVKRRTFHLLPGAVCAITGSSMSHFYLESFLKTMGN